MSLTVSLALPGMLTIQFRLHAFRGAHLPLMMHRIHSHTA